MRTLMTVTAAAITSALVLVPTSAQAASKVTISNDQGTAKVDPKYATTIKVNGSGFQSIKNAHGGIYVFFGTVSGTWRPSKGGQVGTNYRYVPDSESKNNQGFQRYVAFPGSDTADAANGGTIKTNGSWSTSMTVPGATFKTVDRAGKVIEVDCLKSTCGIITIGAHGVKNPKNETFTPVSFESLGTSKAPATQETTAAPTTSTDTGSNEVAKAPVTKTVDPAKAIATVDRGTAVVGRVLSFTGSGFLPGEQVIATLDDGRAAVGPLSAGPSGEIAGVLQLPEGTQAGTHVLRLTGAASGAKPSVNFPIAADTAAAASDDESGLPAWAPWAFLAVALLALLSAVTFTTMWLRAQRKKHKTSPPPTSPTGSAAHAL